MSIPPSNQPPSSNQPNRKEDSSQGPKNQPEPKKDFQLPSNPAPKQKEVKKESPFTPPRTSSRQTFRNEPRTHFQSDRRDDSRSDRRDDKKADQKEDRSEQKDSDANVGEKEQSLKGEIGKGESVASSGTTEGKVTNPVSQIGQTILDMVNSMQVGTVDGKTFVSMNLADASAKVPDAFKNCNLSLTMTQNGLSIQFKNFMTPQQEQQARILMEQNKAQLKDLVQKLNAKNIQVSDIMLGSQTINLPRVEPLPPPFQSPSTREAEREEPSGDRREEKEEKEE